MNPKHKALENQKNKAVVHKIPKHLVKKYKGTAPSHTADKSRLNPKRYHSSDQERDEGSRGNY